MKAKYKKVKSPFNGKYKRAYVVKAEIALGKELDVKHPVHHHNNELVICENKIYHQLLHDNTDALRACGNTSWRRCTFCKEYDAPKNLVFSVSKTYHRKCNATYMLKYRR